jgi:hypothetical protein
MKRSLLVAGILVLAVLVGACSGETTTSTTTTSSTASETSTTSGTTSTTATSLPAADSQAIRHQQTEPRFTYSGTWKKSSAAEASKGSFVYADSSGASLTIRFIGTHLAWIAKQSPVYGMASVTVDGGDPATVDLFSLDTLWQQTVWETDTLAEGSHTVEIEWTGTKGTAATGTNINVDAIDVDGVVTGLYQQDNAKLVYSGNWTTTSNASASGGDFAFADSSGSSVTINFNGVELDWFAKQSPAYGNAQVTVDEGSPVTVNLYSADVLWEQMVWSTGILTLGSHTVEIAWTGTKDASATGTNISIDSLDVTGTLK